MNNRFNTAPISTNDIYSSARIAFFNAAKNSTGNIHDFSAAEKLLCITYPEHSNTIKMARRDVEETLDNRS